MKKLLFAAMVMLCCQASCNKVGEDCKGPAIPDCMTTMEYNPVCGCDGKEYSNPGMAKCAGLKKWTEGKCPTK